METSFEDKHAHLEELVRSHLAVFNDLLQAVAHPVVVAA